MWEAIKAIGGMVLLVAIVLALFTTFFIFSWAFKILGFIVALMLIVAFLGWFAWEMLSGWWQERKNK